MLPRHLPREEEEDSGRRRNQFSKDERLHLLNIMSQYAPLLDDTSASVFDRREIWRAIERDFHLAGFTGKTSAQLKKYWQNYKYHGRRAQAGVRKHSSATSKEAMEESLLHAEVLENRDNLEMTKITKGSATPCVSLRLDASPRNVVESGCRQRQIYGDNGTFLRKLSATTILSTAASPGKKRKNDDHSIFPTVAVAAKGRCFLLQPRQTDNHDGVINKRENAVETRRKLESAKKESTVLPSKFAWRSEISCSESEASRSISATSREDLPTEDFAASHTRDIRDSTCCRGRCEESKIHENAASLRNQQNDLDETASDAARSHIPNIGLWDRDTDNLLQSELRDELGYRLMLHRLETEEKRLKVKIAEMAIQEIRFRIRALNEDVRRADELHELHLALATAQAKNFLQLWSSKY
ncbi:glucuronate isomerase [Lasius niger]|uniref:Regulatory protein zeste n=1 Tax=Lasius niger TaxID=67767 RepID=A0A0J7LBC2_LASNI|nr:glucuronate isomerase [Lasius niger]